LKEGKLTKDQLRDIIKNKKNGRLGEAIIAQKMLQPYEVFELLTKQAEMKLYDIFTWIDGGIEFYDDYKMVDIAVPLNIKFHDLAIKGLIDYTPRDKFKKIFQNRLNLKIIKKESDFNLSKLRLTPKYLRIINNILYNETIKKNVDSLRNESFEIGLYQLLYFLFEIKYITFK